MFDGLALHWLELKVSLETRFVTHLSYNNTIWPVVWGRRDAACISKSVQMPKQTPLPSQTRMPPAGTWTPSFFKPFLAVEMWEIPPISSPLQGTVFIRVFLPQLWDTSRIFPRKFHKSTMRWTPCHMDLHSQPGRACGESCHSTIPWANSELQVGKVGGGMGHRAELKCDQRGISFLYSVHLLQKWTWKNGRSEEEK